jgi:CBS domain-containing protein
MHLQQAIVETRVARPGMSIGEALSICVESGLPGIPFIGQDDRISGRFSVRHVFLVYSLPSDMVKGAHLIGHQALHLEHTDEHYAELFKRPIDDLILPDAACMAPGAQVTKAMALMEKFNSSYLFVVDDRRYLGVVTRLGLTRALLRHFWKQ